MGGKTKGDDGENIDAKKLWKEITDIKVKLAIVDERTKNLWRLLVILFASVVGLYIANFAKP